MRFTTIYSIAWLEEGTMRPLLALLAAGIILLLVVGPTYAQEQALGDEFDPTLTSDGELCHHDSQEIQAVATLSTTLQEAPAVNDAEVVVQLSLEDTDVREALVAAFERSKQEQGLDLTIWTEDEIVEISGPMEDISKALDADLALDAAGVKVKVTVKVTVKTKDSETTVDATVEIEVGVNDLFQVIKETIKAAADAAKTK